MAHRTPTARFMGDAWVFPGGVVDETDGSPRVAALVRGPQPAELAWIAAGMRELVEEVGLWLVDAPFVERVADPAPDAVWARAEDSGVVFDGSAPVLIANWVTPTAVPVRFDARFYAVVVPGDLVCLPDEVEVDAAEWWSPQRAVALAGSGEIVVPFPTRKTLEQLARFEDASAVLEHFAALERIVAVQPRLRVGATGRLEVLLPGDPGFDEVDESAPPVVDVLRRVAGASASPEVAD